MPESDAPHVDYYPSSWTEYADDEYLVEWVYNDDETIIVRVDGTMSAEYYSVAAITGVNDRGEEFLANQMNQLDEQSAFETAGLLLYAMNGTAGRIAGKDEFCGDQV
ncbi:hypothetical protein AUR64_04110 [Haloprofundus marisrubri]|uniref:Uncharacterized protein n=1 Tax=Haloprofundus marisrubri TaxID=1514971 RepID=A0A0W1RE75_9EURY|nr:hypothetical protein [Haloprofundus marisrubri]KTG11446.1 hypothetical protein AUR64_04110 [Haloprofundus marisrubri]